MSAAPFTPAAQRLVALAEELGLRPEVRAPRCGVVQVALNGRTERGGFGDIQIGARTGRVLRMRLWVGNHQIHLPAARVTHTGYLAAYRQLRRYRGYALGWELTRAQLAVADRADHFVPVHVPDGEVSRGRVVWSAA
jgi:hypothetical protein